MTIALLGVTGFRNRGVEALTLPVIEHLLSRKSPSSIRVFSWSADHDQARVMHAAVYFQATSFIRVAAGEEPLSLKHRLKRMLKSRLPSHKKEVDSSALVNEGLVSQLQGCHLAIITGGDVYSSDYGTDSLRYYCSLIHSAKAAGLPVVLLGHTVGRFSKPEDLQAWRACAQHLTLLTTRDQLTYDYLQSVDGLAPHTEVCADVAFGLTPALQASQPKFPGPPKPCIALSVSKGLHRWCDLSATEHFQAWLSLLAEFIHRWDVNILMIPHVQEPYGDDRQLATDLHRAMGFDARIHVAAEDLSASEYKCLMSTCDMVIAERMHAAIAGLSTQVPTVMVSYSLKVEGIADLAYRQLSQGSSHMVVAANSLQNPSAVLMKLSGVWNNRAEVKECLAQSIPTLELLARQNFTHLDILMEGMGLS